MTTTKKGKIFFIGGRKYRCVGITKGEYGKLRYEMEAVHPKKKGHERRPQRYV